MRAVKDKKKFGWNKKPKNRNCKKFGYGRWHSRFYPRNILHILLFRTEGWDSDSPEFARVIRDIRYYYKLHKEGVNIFNEITKYRYWKIAFWKTTEGRYYHTLATHIEQLYATLKLRGGV